MENKMTIRQLRNAVCIGDYVVLENNIFMQSTHDKSGKHRVDLTNIMCSYEAILSLPVEKLCYADGKFIAMIDIPVAALTGMMEDVE